MAFQNNLASLTGSETGWTGQYSEVRDRGTTYLWEGAIRFPALSATEPAEAPNLNHGMSTFRTAEGSPPVGMRWAIEECDAYRDMKA